MKIIYFGSGNQIKSGFTTLKDRDLVLNTATNNREQYMVSLLKTLNTKLVYVSSAYGLKKGPFRTQKLNTAKLDFVALGYWSRGLRRMVTSLSASFIFIITNVKKGDLIITYNFPPIYALPLLIMKLFIDFKLVINFEDFFNEGDWRAGIYSFFNELGLKRSNAFIAVSEGTKKFVTDLKPNAKVVVNGGYYLQKVSPEKKITRQDGAPIRILYSGTLDQERGIVNLLSSFKINPSLNFNLRLSGKGPLDNYIIEASKADSRINYLGYLGDEEYASEVDNADICICSQWSSISVNFPSKITSYLSLGKIVLCTEISSLINSPYKDLLFFYDDENENENGLWSSLEDIKDNFDSLILNTPNRAKSFQNLMIKQEAELIDLLRSQFLRV